MPPGSLEELRLMVSELVTNAIKYGAGHEHAPIVLDLRVNDGVRFAVIDNGCGFPSDRVTVREPHWGLKVVDRLANRWGITRSGARTHVWVEARLSNP